MITNEKRHLIPMTKKEIAAAFNMSYNYLWRQINHLDIPPKKVSPKNILRICDCCDMDVERIIEYIERYNLRS